MKSVLVINTPDSCFDCDICSTYYDDMHEEYVRYCELVGNVPLYGIHKDCPLKPLPSKKVPAFDPNSASYDEEYEKRIMNEIDGWNACLEELEK